MTEAEAPAEKPARARWPLWVDLGVLIAVLPIMFAGIRVLVYSGGDPVILRTLIGTLDVPAVVMGTLLPLIPILVFSFFQFLILDSGRSQWALRGAAKWAAIIFGIIAIALYALLGPYPGSPIIIGSLALGLLTGQIIYLASTRKARADGSIKRAKDARPDFSLRRNVYVWVSPAVLIGVILLLPLGMWLPSERLDLDDGTSIETYVLRTSSGWMTTIDADKIIRQVPADSVEARTVCDQGNAETLALVWLTPRSGVDIPTCS